MRKLAEYGRDDHSDQDPERARLAWSVGLLDDCEGCLDEIRVELVLEEVGKPGTGLAAHLAPSTARRLRSALTVALRQVGEDLEF